MKRAILVIATMLSACAGSTNAGVGTAQRDHLRIVLEPGVPFGGCVLRYAALYDSENLGACELEPSPQFDRPARTALLTR